jgi:hypothetical protein
MARPWTVEQVAGIESALTALEKAQADKDWPEMQKRAQEALAGATRLTHGPAVTSIAPRNDPQKMSELRGSVLTLRHHLQQAEQAIRDHDEAKLDAALRDFRKAFDPVREAAKKPAP